MSNESFRGNLQSRGIYFRYGVALGAAGAGLAMIALIHSGQVIGWERGLLWIPLWVFCLTFIQAREKTCAFMAAQGVKECEGGVCPLEPGQCSQARHAAISILARSFVIATVACAAILWLLGG